MKKFFSFLLLLNIVNSAYPQIDSSKYPKLSTNTGQQNQEHMMQLLGIKKLRPGASANEGSPNYANYDPAKANPCPQLPDILTLKNGNNFKIKNGKNNPNFS